MARAAVRPRRGELAAMAVGLAVRLVWIPLGAGTARFTNTDSDSYLYVARRLGGILWSPTPDELDYGLLRTPVYPVFLRLATPGLGLSPTAIVVAQCVVGGVVNVWLTARLARRLVDRLPSGPPAAATPAVATIAAFVVALDPISIGHSLVIGTETVFVTVLLLTALAVVRAVQADVMWRWGAVAGGLAGLAALTRPAMVYFPLVVALVWLWAGRDRRSIVAVTAFLAAAAVPIGGWVARNAAVTGADRLVFSTAQGQNLFAYGATAQAYDEERIRFRLDTSDGWDRDLARAEAELSAQHPDAGRERDVVVRDAAWTRIGFDAVVDHPGGFAAVAVMGLVRAGAGPGHSLLATVGGLGGGGERVLLVLCAAVLLAQWVTVAAGTAVLVRRRAALVLLVLATPVLYYLLVSAGPYMYARFRVPVVPFVAVLAALGVTSFTSVAVRRRTGPELAGK